MTDRILNLPKVPKWWRREYTLILIVLMSALLHAWTVWQLPVDFDEPVYLSAGADYADLIRSGDLRGVVNYEENREHPALVKLLYSTPYLLFPDLEDPMIYLYLARVISAIFGVLAVWVLTEMNLWAGLFFALHSMTLKYTSQAYLEALPMFAMLFAVFLLVRYKDKRFTYYLSAFFIGVIAASKFTYLVIVPVILFILFFILKKNIKEVFFYGLTALLAALILNPSLWGNPIREIYAMLQYHTGYSQSAHVESSGYPWYEPIIFMSTSVPWHPQVFFFFSSDEFMAIIALAGLYFEFRERKWSVLWIVLGIITLLFWPTKWPQYTLIVSPVIALIAGSSIQRLIDWIRPKNEYWNYLEEMLPQPPKITWYLVAGMVIALAVGKVAYEYNLALGRQGWTQFTTSNSPLISDTINALDFDDAGNIIFGSNYGVGIWSPDEDSYWGEAPKVFTKENAGLPSNRILTIEFDEKRGITWIGTDNGLAAFKNDLAFPIEFTKIGCAECMINDLYLDNENKLWLATGEGVFFYDGGNWTAFSALNPGAEADFSLSIYVEPSGKIWIGTLEGLSVYEEGRWENINWAGNFFGWGGVSEIIQGDDGTVYAATLGGGVNFWDGAEWQHYRNTNTKFRSNTVNTLVLDDENQLWVGLGYPTEPGGIIMSQTNENADWKRYSDNNSGYYNGEPMAMKYDAYGRLWIVTNGNGIQSFLKP